MKLETVLLGTLPSEKIRSVKSIQGPHLDSEGKIFTPANMGVLSLKEIMETQHLTDLYFTCYTIGGLDAWPRLSKQALSSFEELVKVTMPVIAFDWDCPEHSKWTPELFEDFYSKLLTIEDTHLASWRYWYTTRHGARILYVLSEGVSVYDAEQYIATMFLKFKEAGLEVDAACKDWTRLFRCPRVVRDGKPSTSDPFFQIEEQDAVLDISTLKKTVQKVIPTLRHFEASGSSRPSHDDISAYLTEKHGNNTVQSAFYKEAKKVFKGVPYYDALFKENVPLAVSGERNNVIMQSLGVLIPIAVSKIPYAKPEHIYALFHGPVSAFEQDKDWYGHLWNAIMSIWPVEVEKHNAAQIVAAKKQETAVNHKDAMIEGMKKWCPHPDLLDDEKKYDFIDRHLLASLAPNTFFLMSKNGTYSVNAIPLSQLIIRIRTTFLSDIIETRELSPLGKWQDINATTIQNRYATPVIEAMRIPQLESDGYIEDMDGVCPVLMSPMYRRNTSLEPTYNESVDEWLSMLFGVHYERGCNWIANALAFEEGPICALSITAPPSVGKTMLIEGLAECLEKPVYATARDMTTDFNAIISKTPFLSINEEWPAMRGESNQEKFKGIVAGDKQKSMEKYEKGIYIMNPMRVIMTANNHDIIKTLLDKDMSADDREAVGLRLLHFDLDCSAAAWLEEKGGNAFTGKRGQRWIARPGEASAYIVAKHFLWLWKERTLHPAGFVGRLLVDGNCGKGSSFMASQIIQKESTALLSSSVINIIESPSSRKNYVLDKATWKLYMTIEAVMSELKMNETPMSFGKVSQVIRNIAASREPILMNYQDHHEINCEYILNFAQQLGRNTPELRKIVENQRKISVDSVVVQHII